MSKRRVISQREARKTSKRLQELQLKHTALIKSWDRDYPGVCLGGLTEVNDITRTALRTAKNLGFALMVKLDNNKGVDFFAVKAP